LEVERNGRKAKVMFPLVAGSYYHLSKIFDTFNVKLANKLFDLTATDIMQGVVYGVQTDELTDPELATRFDFDSIWGTLINKYVIQAVALNKLLIYGKGKQKRGFLSLYDSINCLTLLLENPPKKGDYRVINQLDEVYDTLELAEKVRAVGKEYGIEPTMEYLENPRVEKDEHFYEVESKILPSLGFKRKKNMDETLQEIFEAVLEHKNRIGDAKEMIYPTVNWRSGKVARSPLFKLPKEITSVVRPEDMEFQSEERPELELVREP
jgi:UDP-sulfoquinovose synthase